MLGAVVIHAVVVLTLGGSGAAAAKPPTKAKPPPEVLVQAQPPPFSDGIFPCTQCHDPKTGGGDRTRRDLGFHADADAGEPAAVFDHDSEHRWCLDCHDLKNRDLLRLANGDTVPFTESYRLCGQCHGDKARDWRAGVHGKRIGRWDGEKTYFLCVNCHNPHTPGFKGVRDIVVDGRPGTAPTLTKLKPEPRPRRPEEDRR